MNRRVRWITSVFLCLILVSAFIPTAAFAAALPETAGSRLAVYYVYDDTAVSGAEFYVYRVADVAEDGYLTLSGDFAEYPVELNVSTSEAFQTAANMLYGFAQLDDLPPAYTLTTDEAGQAAAEGLEDGLYLVAGQNHEQDGVKYTCQPQLVALPRWEEGSAEPSYDVTLIPKCETEEEPNPEPVSLKVLKKWNDNGNLNDRPTNITVYLLKDGEVYDTVKLDKTNNWRHTWEELDGSGTWTVVEDVPKDYTVSITKEGITYVITNTNDTPPPTTPPDDDIPQTGMLWWPVPVLVILGVALIVAGSISRKRPR